MISEISKSIPPFYVMEILEKAKQIEASGEKVIHLEIGEPDHNTDTEICEEAIESIKAGETKYTHSQGLIELRNEIANHYRIKYGVSVSPDNIIVTSGSSPALYLAFLTMLNAGDEIIITNPHYACYPQIIRVAGGMPNYVGIKEEDDFQMDVFKLKEHITPNTKALLVNSPCNPTGMMLRPEVLKDISELGIFVISDEIYHGLVYGEKEHSILEYTDRAIVINGFSKLYSMTGWRLGYIIAPDEFIRPIQKLQQNLFISASSFVQKAAIRALKLNKEKISKIVKLYKNRRKVMFNGLRQTGFDLRKMPDGAFYYFVNVSEFKKNSLDLAFDILEKVHVAVTPGIDFGSGGEGYLRFSYANSEDNILEGLKRLKYYINNFI